MRDFSCLTITTALTKSLFKTGANCFLPIDLIPERDSTQSSAHHHPAASRKSLSLLLMENQSPPGLTNHLKVERQCRGSPQF